MDLFNKVGKNKIILKEFLRFLKDEGAYFSYLRNLHTNIVSLNNFNRIYKHNIEIFFKLCPPPLWTTECFVWVSQKEGRPFWENIHKKWNTLCNIKEFFK